MQLADNKLNAELDRFTEEVNQNSIDTVVCLAVGETTARTVWLIACQNQI